MQRDFSQLESVEFKCWFAIEKLKNVAVTSLMSFLACIYSTLNVKLCLFSIYHISG